MTTLLLAAITVLRQDTKPSAEQERIRKEQVETARALATLPKASEIEVFLLPSSDPQATGVRASVIQRRFKRHDKRLALLLSALTNSQKTYPYAVWIYSLCGFHADVLVRPSKGRQVVLCFGCSAAAITDRGRSASFSFEETPYVGGWRFGDAKKVAAVLTDLFPGETFPR